jgi:hypothetical protein
MQVSHGVRLGLAQIIGRYSWTLGSREKAFYFEQQWLLEEDILDIFSKDWQTVRLRFHDNRHSLDIWYECLSLSR